MKPEADLKGELSTFVYIKTILKSETNVTQRPNWRYFTLEL